MPKNIQEQVVTLTASVDQLQRELARQDTIVTILTLVAVGLCVLIGVVARG